MKVDQDYMLVGVGKNLLFFDPLYVSRKFGRLF